MATQAKSLPLDTTRARPKEPVGGLRFDWIMLALSTWLTGGIFTDGWAHAHIPQLETFFTPWHAVLYSGYLAVASGLGISILMNYTRGYRGRKAIPRGYELSVLGAVVFGVSGVGDMIWHILFGIEKSTEALLSPTHLGLALGVILMMSAPFRTAWSRKGDGAASWRNLLPMLISLIFTLSILTFFTEYANPIGAPYAIFQASTVGNANRQVTLGVDSYLIFTTLLMGFVLLTTRRWRLPMGALTLVFTVNGALMGIFSNQYRLVPALLLAGLAADLLLRWLQPGEKRPLELRLFAFLVPLTLYLLYFLNLMLVDEGTTWSVHLWMGSAVIAGFAGLLLSFLVVPPARPVES